MVITISREYGAGGSAVAERVARALDWKLVDNELVEQVAERAGLTAAEVARREERLPGFAERLARTLAVSAPQLFPPSGETLGEPSERTFVRITETVVGELAVQGRLVLVGRAAPAVLGQQEGMLHVRLVAPKLVRVQRTVERLGVSAADAERLVTTTDAQRALYHREYYDREWADPLNYHMVLNTGALGLAGAADIVAGRARALGWAGERPG